MRAGRQDRLTSARQRDAGFPGDLAARDLDAMPQDFQPDPSDPVQTLDDMVPLHLDALEVDAVTTADAEAAQDLATLDAELDENAQELDTPELTDMDAIASAQAGKDDGVLYGVHTPRAVDRDLPDDDHAFAEGENWIEALQASATENGAEPERELDVIDEEDLDSPPTDHRDIPVADRGAAGPRGL